MRSDTIYREFAPDPAWRSHVSVYWQARAKATYPPGALHPIWPDGSVSIVIIQSARFSGVRVVGPRIEPLRVPMHGGDRVCGIRLWPDVGGVMLGVDARRLRDVVGPAAPFLDADRVAELFRAVETAPRVDRIVRGLDRWIGPLVRGAPPIDAAVRGAVTGLIDSSGRASISDLAAESGLSMRQLQRRFGDRVGLTPKQFGRIRRIRSALARLLATPQAQWGRIAAELDFSDHAHLVRDVAKLIGLTPTEIRHRLEQIDHVNVTP